MGCAGERTSRGGDVVATATPEISGLPVDESAEFASSGSAISGTAVGTNTSGFDGVSDEFEVALLGVGFPFEGTATGVFVQ